MRVTIVGSGDAFGSGGRFQTCVGLGDPVHTLVDCGATSLTALRQQRIDPNGIGTVVLTHLHGDHFGGLPFLVLDGQFRRRERDLTVLGPPGTAQRLATAIEVLFPGSSTARRRFEMHVREHASHRRARVDGLSVTPFEVRHAAGAPAYGVRVGDGDRTLAYTGDTEWTDALLELADGADLLLAEGYSPAPVRWHLDLGSLAAHRDRLGCARVVLTHLSPAALAADLTGWDVARDGLALDL